MSTAVTPIQEFKSSIAKLELGQVLPSHIPEEKFKQVVITAIQKSPKLLQFNRQSLWNACMECAQDGLLPDGREAALVPFKGQVKYMPMIQGITKKARNSGEIATIDALVVYENDQYESWVDEKGAHFRHARARTDRGNPILTYAYALTKDGSFYFEEIDEVQMKAIEQKSAANDSPWKGPFKDEMKRKSALRRLCKYRLPSSTDIDTIIRRDDDMYDLDEAQEEKPKTSDEPKRSKLEDVVDAHVTEEPAVDEATDEVVDSGKKTVSGVVDDLKTKSGETNGKKWTKYGGRIDGEYYGTFSRSLYEAMVESADDKKTIIVEYEEKERDGKIFREALSAKFEEVVFDDDDVPI